MLYFSTGNAGPDYDGSMRPGDNLFAASIVALDYKTGQYKWHFQEVHHDIWDFDAPSPVVLFDQMYNGTLRKGLYQAGKTGWLYFLDRTNGQPLIGIDEKPVPQEPRQFTSATQPYPAGDSFIYQCPDAVPGFIRSGCIFAAWWDIATLTRPTGHGGSEWSPTTYDPQTGFVYVMGSEQTSAAAMRPAAYVHGKSYGRGVTAPPPPVTKVELNGNPIKLGAPMGATNTLLGDTIFNGRVEVVDYLFQPQQVQVPKGTTVTFNNSGTITHTATAQDNSWDTGDI